LDFRTRKTVTKVTTMQRPALFFVILKERKNDSIEKQTIMYCSNKPNPVQTYRKYPNKVKPRPAQPSLQYENLA
jgi:hypothetical protein